MANFTDLLDVMPPCGVVVSRLCPCLAFLFKTQHADREVETVSLMGSQSRAPDPDTDHVPSAAAELWFQKMQASVYRGEPRRRALAAGRSRPDRPIPQPTPQPQKSPKPQPRKQPQPQKSPKPQPQEQPQPQKSPKPQPQEQPQPQKSPGKLRAAPRLIRAGSSIESTGSQ